jgi:hypothetical protein
VTRRAVAFIERHQNPDGGFPASDGIGSNAQSTAWAVQGLVASGVRGAPVRRALAYLDSLISPNGHVRYSRSSDQTPVWVTAEAAMALVEKPLPLAAVPVRPRTRAVAASPRRPQAKPAHRVGGARRRLRRARGRGRTAAAAEAPSQLSMTLAGDAGLLDALALAPLGIG